MFQAMIYSD